MGRKATKPKTKKQKGKRLEELTAKIIHQVLYDMIPEYKSEFDMNNKISPHRDFSSGTFKHNLCDIELNFAEKYLPFCIECKNWAEFKEYSIFDLFKRKSKFLSSLNKIFNHTAEKIQKIPLVVFKSNYTDILVYSNLNFFEKNFIEYLTNNIQPLILLPFNFFICRFEDFLITYIAHYYLRQKKKVR